MSDTSPRSRKGLPAALLLLAAIAFLPGCLASNRPTIDKAGEDLLAAKGDKSLRTFIRNGGQEPGAVIAVFRKDVFLGQSAMLDRSSIPVLGELGNAALLLIRPGEALPLLRDPSVLKVASFGPQGHLARLEPSLEFEMLNRFGKGTEGQPVPVLARFRSIPGQPEEQAVETAGFKVLSRGGPNLLLSGPVSGVPNLLGNEWIVYLEKGNSL